jgi:hypothetical protein
MKLSIFNSLFKQKSSSCDLSHSKVLDKLKKVCEKDGLYLYQDITIYHHAKSFNIPLLVVDLTRGIYLFEYKTWSLQGLKNAKAQQAKDQESSDKTLAFDKTHKIIKQKFNELTHSDGVDIFNFMLMENLTLQDYEQLDVSLQELLPQSKIIFSDSSEEEILTKLQDTAIPNESPTDIAHIMGILLIQYLILSDDNSIDMATQEQITFIDAQTQNFQTLSGENGSGKTSTILLKTVLYKLKNPNKKIIIISPTTLSCDLLKKKLLDIVENGIIELDITSVEIITPIELLNKQLKKHNKLLLEKTIYIDPILMKKKFQVADLIICDDSDLLPDDFISYLKHIQNKASLIIASNKLLNDATFLFTKNFHNIDIDVKFIKTNPHAKALQIISKLLKDDKTKDVLVISDELSKSQLSDDLEFFIKDDAIVLDGSKNLIDQKLDNLLLTTYSEISSIDASFVILLGVPQASLQELKYAIGCAKECAYILYEDESETIKNLKENYKQEDLK